MYPNNFFRYEGEWKDGKKHGKRKLNLVSGFELFVEFLSCKNEQFKA